MGGKTAQTSSQVSIPPEVLARYNSVNATAQTAASQPFQQYSTDPNAFVAPVNSQQQQGIAGINAAAGSYAPYYNAATTAATNSAGAGLSYFDAANQNIAQAAQTGAAGTQAAYAPLSQGLDAATGLQGGAASSYGAAYAGLQPYLSGATQATTDALQNAQPYNQAATGLTNAGLAGGLGATQAATAGTVGAYQGAQPYNSAAGQLAAAGAGPVNASSLDSSAINKYLSPYLNTVLSGTLAPLIQQQQQQQSGLAGNQVLSGTFGGDRGGISQAVLAQQQNLALGQTAANILTPAYENALATAQQQQGVNLGAGQANRSAIQNAEGQVAGLGQQVYGQGTGSAAQIGALGQQGYSQNLGAASQLQGIGQQGYAQGLGAASQLQGIGQAGFNAGSQTGQNLASLGQQEFGQGAATSAQEAALAQQGYSQGANTAQVQAGLGQGVYGIGSGLSSQLAGLGSGVQQAGLAGGQAQVGAGTLEQQTGQAGLSALYNQFQQQQGYPFQVAQFLANIAEGTGALSGSTTTSTQPAMSFLSDERAKEDMEPIGKTFEGQNIYKFRYKGGDPRKQIGLSAQETEHYHPEAVGEMGGLKTVDYDKATSAGGAVANDNGGEGFAQGGAPGFDLGSILQAQQGMYAPFAQGNAGGYGASIPNKESTHTLATSQAPKIAPVDLGKVAGGLDSAIKTGKGIADKINDWTAAGAPMNDVPGTFADGVFDTGAFEDGIFNRGGLAHKADGGSLDTPYPLADTYASYLAQQKMHPFTQSGLYGNPLIGSGVAGPYATMLENPNSSLRILSADAPRAVKAERHDPSHESHDALAKALTLVRRKSGALPDDQEGQASGGRQQRALGGTSMNMPYSSSGTGYVPEQEEPTHTLAVSQPPSQQGGSGLGGIMDLAKTGLSLAALFNKGGRIGYDDGGEVDPPGFLPRAIDWSAFPRALGLGATAKPDAGPSATVPIPEGAFSDSKGAPHVLDIQPQAHAAHNSRGLAPSIRPTPRPQMPGDELPPMPNGLDIGSYPAPPAETAPDAPPAAAPSDPAPEQPGFFQKAGDTISDAYHSLGLGGPKGSSPGATPTSGPDSDFMSRNQSWLIPLLKGVGSATLYPGKSPIGALTYGAEQGAESYADIQNQLADRQLTGAEVQQTGANTFNMLQRNAPPNFMVVAGSGPNAFTGPDGKTYHYVNKADYYGNADGSQNGIAAYNTAPRENALEMDYQKGIPTITPSSDTDKYLEKTFRGFVPGADPVKNQSRIFSMNPALEGRDKQDADIAKGVIGDPGVADSTHRQYVQLADAINSLSQDSLSGRGASFDYRQKLANVYQTGRRLLGYGDDPSVTSNLVAGDIINKIQSLTGTALADQSGQHSHEIANALSSVLPGGEHQLGSANEVLSTMMVQNQRQRDFSQYYNQYIGRYGISAGVNDAFNRDMGPRYDAEQKQIGHLFAKAPGGKSLYDLIQENPGRISKIENGYTDAGGVYHPGLGIGLSRYVR